VDLKHIPDWFDRPGPEPDSHRGELFGSGPGDRSNGIAWQAAHFPIDSKTNERVKNILTPAMWKKFVNSHCGSVIGNSQGMTAMIANYSLQVVQKKQDMTNFYDIGNPEVEDLAL
jgi:hypothetical protein